MKRTVVTFFVAAAIALAGGSAATYKVKLLQPSVVNGTELKAGDYKVQIDGDKATIWQGKNSVAGEAKVETADQKYNTTAFRYGQNSTLQEIHLGGTNTKLVFESAPGSAAAGGSK
jgi:hypothetical protein